MKKNKNFLIFFLIIAITSLFLELIGNCETEFALQWSSIINDYCSYPCIINISCRDLESTDQK